MTAAVDSRSDSTQWLKEGKIVGEGVHNKLVCGCRAAAGKWRMRGMEQPQPPHTFTRHARRDWSYTRTKRSSPADARRGNPLQEYWHSARTLPPAPRSECPVERLHGQWQGRVKGLLSKTCACVYARAHACMHACVHEGVSERGEGETGELVAE